MSYDLYNCTPRTAREFVIDVLEARRVPNLISSPGIGKSSIMRSIAQEFGLFLIDWRVSTAAPEDFTGLPEFYTNEDGIRSARFSPFTEVLPVKGMTVPKGYEGFFLFLDEFNSGTKMVQAAAYKTILDHQTGVHELHPQLLKACAGNLMTDRAITEELSTAMQSRLVHIQMIHDHTEFMEDVALPNKWDERIIGYLNFQKDHLMDFKPDHTDKTFCCPRTWEFMNDMIQGKEVPARKTALYAGTITSGVAAEFVAYCAIYKELITIREILADPENAAVPMGHDKQRAWAIVTHLMSRVDEKNFKDVATYINRFDLTFRILFFRGMIAQQPKLRSHPAFIKAVIELDEYLNPKVI